MTPIAVPKGITAGRDFSLRVGAETERPDGVGVMVKWAQQVRRRQRRTRAQLPTGALPAVLTQSGDIPIIMEIMCYKCARTEGGK